jgi:hypothetical protein
MRRWFALIAATAVAGCTTVGAAHAQSTYSDETPLIAGRIALAEGDARIWRVEDENTAGQWDEAMTNDVVSAGTGLYTGSDGRNEIRVGPHTVRLGANSRGGFRELDYDNAVFDLEYGALNVRLARPEHGERTAVTVGDVRLELTAPGRYRIDATDRGPLRLTVFEGHGTVRAPGHSAGVGGGQAVVIDPNSSGVDYEQAQSTGFDQWALGRDEQYANVRAAQYVSPYMTGYEDLDRYGDWVPDATYGTVWYPRAVPAGWAPYRHGQWRWVRPWGWTWVDYAPWGYAPFHYGRWVLIGPRWCWVPGGYVRRPVWAPALVGFVGGSGFAISVGGPVVGWYPLAPWHRYTPHYRHSPTYVTIINQTVINRVPRGVPPTVNQGPGATMVPGPRFRDPVMKVALPVKPKPEQLKPAAPPPLSVAPAPRPSGRKFAAEQDARTSPGSMVPGARGVQAAPAPAAPAQPTPAQPPQAVAPPRGPKADEHARGPQAGAPPTRVSPPLTAEPVPGRGVRPQPPLPGNDPAPLAQPPGLKRGQPVAPPAERPTAPPRDERPMPRPHLPSDQIPPGQPKPTNPNEPARFPPGAPPTIRQPQPIAPAARPVQPTPPPAPRAELPAARPVQPMPPASQRVEMPSARPQPTPPPASRVELPSARPAPRAEQPPPARPAPPVVRPAPTAPRATAPVPPAAATPPPRRAPQAAKEPALRQAQQGNERGRGGENPGRGKQP